MKKVIVFILVGILLIVGVIATGTYGLSEENIKIYKMKCLLPQLKRCHLCLVF